MKHTLTALALVLAASAANAQFAAAGSQAGSASQAGASSGSSAAIILNQNTPETQDINQNVTYTTRAEQILSGGVHDTQDVRYSGTQTLKNVPAIAMSGPASGPCTGVSGGIGIAGPGWGFGANGSSVMADCRLRENTRVLGMAMQSVDGAASPKEKGELMVMFMDAARGLAAYNAQILADEVKPRKEPK